jgi:glycopeptide antibiotics resistance protein
MFVFILFFIPFGFYVMANNIKNIKIAKVLLIVGLLLCAVLLVGWLVGWFASSSITSYFDVGKFSVFFIPFVAYIFLFYKTTHKKSPRC